MIRSCWPTQLRKMGHVLCRQMSVYLLAEYFKEFFVGNTGTAEWVKREVCERETERSQRILNLVGTHVKERARGKQGAMPPPPRAQTLRSILGAARSREEAGELLVSERARTWRAKCSPYLADTDYWYNSAGKNAFFFKRTSPIPRGGGHFRNQCFKCALNLVSGVGQITNKLCDLFKGVKTLQIKYDFGRRRK